MLRSASAGQKDIPSTKSSGSGGGFLSSFKNLFFGGFRRREISQPAPDYEHPTTEFYSSSPTKTGGSSADSIPTRMRRFSSDAAQETTSENNSSSMVPKGKRGGAITAPINRGTRDQDRGSKAKIDCGEDETMNDGRTLSSTSADQRDPRSVAPLPRKMSRSHEYKTGSTKNWNAATMFNSLSPFSTSPATSTRQALTSAAAPPAAPSSSGASAGPGAKNGVLCCDKCDGKHETENCPYYKKQRDDHIDAKKNGWKLVGGTSTLPGAILRSARVVSQPGDGSCLFHSLSYGIKDGSTATTLRREICEYIRANPATPICETPLSDWVKWDSGTSCADYARKMSRGSWGGGIEMACMSRLKGCNVHVYERHSLTGSFKRISAFDHPIKPEQRKIVRVLYRGGVHYDAMVAD